MNDRRKQLSGPAKAGLPWSAALALGLWLATQIFNKFGSLPVDVELNAAAIRQLHEQCELRCAAAVERDRVQNIAIERNASKIDAILSRPDARIGVLTIDQGRKLEDQIRDNERRIDKLEK